MPTPLNILLCNLSSFRKHYINKKPFRASLSASYKLILQNVLISRFINSTLCAFQLVSLRSWSKAWPPHVHQQYCILCHGLQSRSGAVLSGSPPSFCCSLFSERKTNLTTSSFVTANGIFHAMRMLGKHSKQMYK